MDFSRPFEVNVNNILEDLIPNYLENRKKDLLQYKDLIAKSDFDELKSMGHKLAGNAGGYGFMGLSEIGFHIEEEADKKNMPRIEEMVSHMQNYIDNVQVNFVEEE